MVEMYAVCMIYEDETFDIPVVHRSHEKADESGKAYVRDSMIEVGMEADYHIIKTEVLDG